jgi:hypothetical protein
MEFGHEIIKFNNGRYFDFVKWLEKWKVSLIDLRIVFEIQWPKYMLKFN